MRKRFELPPSVHDHARYRVWNRRGYDMTAWSEKKIQEKLNYVHNNPLKRGLVAQPGGWPWSRGGGEVLLPEGQFCFDHGPDYLRCNWERSHRDNCGADIQTNVCATCEVHAGLLACGTALLGPLLGMNLETARRRQVRQPTDTPRRFAHFHGFRVSVSGRA
jgi:hypothetical protein